MPLYIHHYNTCNEVHFNIDLCHIDTKILFHTRPQYRTGVSGCGLRCLANRAGHRPPSLYRRMCTDAIEIDTCTVIKKVFYWTHVPRRGEKQLSGVALATMRVLVEDLIGTNEDRMLVCKDAVHHYEPSRQDGLSRHRPHSLRFEPLDRSFSVCQQRWFDFPLRCFCAF